MSLFIVRVTETPGHMVRTRLPGDYGDGQAVMQAMNKELAKYLKWTPNLGPVG